MCLPYKKPTFRSLSTLISIGRFRLLQRLGSKDVRRAINGAQLTALLILGLPVRKESGPSFVFKSVPGRSRKRANDRHGSSSSKHNFLATATASVVVVIVRSVSPPTTTTTRSSIGLLVSAPSFSLLHFQVSYVRSLSIFTSHFPKTRDQKRHWKFLLTLSFSLSFSLSLSLSLSLF